MLGKSLLGQPIAGGRLRQATPWHPRTMIRPFVCVLLSASLLSACYIRNCFNVKFKGKRLATKATVRQVIGRTRSGGWLAWVAGCSARRAVPTAAAAGAWAAACAVAPGWAAWSARPSTRRPACSRSWRPNRVAARPTSPHAASEGRPMCAARQESAVPRVSGLVTCSHRVHWWPFRRMLRNRRVSQQRHLLIRWSCFVEWLKNSDV